MRKLDSTQLDSSAETAESRGVAGAPAADRASAGSRDLFVIHDVPGQPVALVAYAGADPVARTAVSPQRALELAMQLIAAARSRL